MLSTFTKMQNQFYANFSENFDEVVFSTKMVNGRPNERMNELFKCNPN